MGSGCSWFRMVKPYRSVKLPSGMLEAVESFVREHPECGYSSLADFVKDSVRHHYCWQVHKVQLREE